MIEGIAKAKGLVSWEKKPIPEQPAKAREKAIKNNEEAEEFALKCGRIPELLESKTVRKVIVVPRKLINIVAN